MKSLLFAAFALSLILVVSAQCDINDALSCVQDYTNMVCKLHACSPCSCMYGNFLHDSIYFFCKDNTLPPALIL